jgi:Uncharacterized protein conserved in bacteria
LIWLEEIFKSAVETSVYPKVIDAPKDGFLSAVAKDGIELKARAKVTVKTNIGGFGWRCY